MSTLALDRPARTHTAAASRPADRAATLRLDLYAPIHKALRLFLVDTLARVGRLDVHDAAETVATLGQLDALLDLCTSHLQHENDFMHPAIEAHAPDGARTTAADHEEHRMAIDALRRQSAELRHAPTEPGALQLYRQLALFVAENLQHMHFEETHNNAALWASYTDAELLEIHRGILASLPLPETLLVSRWMFPASNPAERAAIAGGMKAGMPAAVFEQVVAAFRPHLDEAAWDKLARATGLAQQPGLVEVR